MPETRSRSGSDASDSAAEAGKAKGRRRGKGRAGRFSKSVPDVRSSDEADYGKRIAIDADLMPPPKPAVAPAGELTLVPNCGILFTAIPNYCKRRVCCAVLCC